MFQVDFFKKQAKILFKCWELIHSGEKKLDKFVDEQLDDFQQKIESGVMTKSEANKFFIMTQPGFCGSEDDFVSLFLYFDNYEFQSDDFKFTLMKAQHFISKIAGFDNWNELLKASDDELKFAKFLFETSGTDVYFIAHLKEYSRQFSSSSLSFDDKIRLVSDSFHFFMRNEIKGIKSKSRKPQILTGLDRYIAIDIERKCIGPFEMDDDVTCIHCGNKYKFNEVTAIKYTGERTPMIMCKNYPMCDGSLIDLFRY